MGISRHLLENAICALRETTHARLSAILDDIGVPNAPQNEGLTKAKDTAARAALVPAHQVDQIARKFIDRVRMEGEIFAREAFSLEEALWKAEGGPVSIPRRSRHELAEHLDGEDIPVFLKSEEFLSSLEGLSLIDSDQIVRSYFGVRPKIVQHMIKNDDYGWSGFFQEVKADDLSDRRFVQLLEKLVAPRVRPNADAQYSMVRAANVVLARCSAELREIGEDGGYPRFALVQKGTPQGRVKNLIFASSIKPDIILRDAAANDIEVVNGGDKVLVYDRPLGREGLRWQDLQAWWAETRNIPDMNVAKQTLYCRLRDILPPDSPPQRLLFVEYHRWLAESVPEMPALLPEVWLHYDPLSARQRGFEVLLRQRMDFLLLFPGDVRVVLEVDGKHHYSDSDGSANPGKYSRMACADRELKLSGYEVYRFGGKELTAASEADQRPAKVLREFFVDLFRRHKVPVPKK
ncbi:MAG: hypothetical protein JNL82_07920 [Myxococcales bacterium]|nr:hypothetical protein [Myxococcales bacterium]